MFSVNNEIKIELLSMYQQNQEQTIQTGQQQLEEIQRRLNHKGMW